MFVTYRSILYDLSNVLCCFEGSSTGILPKKYPCVECGRQFRRICDMNRHLISHDPKPSDAFKCPQCKYTAKHAYTLDLHMSRVHGDRKYVCDKCDKTFSTPKDLEVRLLGFLGILMLVFIYRNYSQKEISVYNVKSQYGSKHF